ncbi:MAG: transcriptional regulator NrdR [Rickettsiales bacterium]|nr:transcriptional regulator NrdR [Rickettsiales bacterium]
MRCPYCNSLESQVKDSRPDADDNVIRRRRICEKCGAKFTTVERVQLRELRVKKSNGAIEPFDRNKIKRSIQVACQKRTITDEQIETIVTSLRRRLELEVADDVIPSEVIGNIVSESLLVIDPIAFVRFASVYRKFSKLSEFRQILSEIPEADAKQPDETKKKFANGKLF